MSYKNIATAEIPLRWVGPVLIKSPFEEAIEIPLATFETPLWASVNRGAKVSREVGGISAVLIQDFMTRSIALEAPNAAIAHQVISSLKTETELTHLKNIVLNSSRFAKLLNFTAKIIGKIIYIRFEFSTGDAAGHNMATHAADLLRQYLLKKYPKLAYIAISGNYCVDKKNSAVNSILGRGKYIIAEIIIPRITCEKILKTTPEKIIHLHVKKNLIGSCIAGSIQSANAHVANILLATYLATGQDAANIIEGSQAIVHCELQADDLYFSLTLPNLIIGTVGNGKDLAFVQKNLQKLGCLEKRSVGENAQRLAIIIATAALCGELSLLAAQTNPGELMRSHLTLERRKN